MRIERLDDATLSVGGEAMDARAVDQLIHDLAVARNAMQPQVPVELRDVATPIVEHHNPDIHLSATADGTLFFGVRHCGLGWCVFTLSRDRAATVRDAIARRTADIPARPGLDDHIPRQHGPH